MLCVGLNSALLPMVLIQLDNHSPVISGESDFCSSPSWHRSGLELPLCSILPLLEINLYAFHISESNEISLNCFAFLFAVYYFQED